ncbi:hypothetical protein HGB07_00420 [Candidatus Roizmanbacteria bacterium]|nr:hypothetical protein [Candidatus Roizmanbacteria bacterium]
MDGLVTKKKKYVMTGILAVVIVVLFVSIFYISSMLVNQSDDTPMAAKKTKASAITYSKTIVIGLDSNQPDTSAAGQVTDTPVPSPVAEDLTPTEAVSPAVGITQYPLVTQVVPSIVDNIATDSGETVIALNVSSTLKPTRIVALPQTGIMQNTFVMFVAASALIFFAFIF